MINKLCFTLLFTCTVCFDTLKTTHKHLCSADPIEISIKHLRSVSLMICTFEKSICLLELKTTKLKKK